jgi:hypothetical protein
MRLSLCDSNNVVPGVDPTSGLRQFAGQKNMLDKFHTVALGQGQGPVAIANINEAVSFSYFYYVLHFAKESIAAGFLHQLFFSQDMNYPSHMSFPHFVDRKP